MHYTVTVTNPEGKIEVQIPATLEHVFMILAYIVNLVTRIPEEKEPIAGKRAYKKRDKGAGGGQASENGATKQDDIKDEIRDLLKDGMKPADIAEKVGCKPPLVYVIKQKMKNAGELSKSA